MTPTATILLLGSGELGREFTIVVIAHRVSTLAMCDRLVVFGEGSGARVVGYDEYLQQRAARDLADAGRSTT